MPAPLAHYENRIQPLEEVRVPALDRGFLFGDGIYEVLRVYRSRPWLEAEHWARLERSLGELRIVGADTAGLRKKMHETIAAGPFGEAIVYIQITRGSAPRRKHSFPKDTKPTELLWVEEYDDGLTAKQRQSGVGVILQPDLRWKRCDVKSVNLLANCLALQTAVERGDSEALLHLPDGTMTEATHSSFFWVRGGVLYSTPGRDNILPGITRQLLMRLTKSTGIEFREEHLKLADVFGVDELFLTGTTSEVLPVVRVDGKSIGRGEPGPVTRRLQTAHDQVVRDWLAGK
jgi:D-alanine transaminase